MTGGSSHPATRGVEQFWRRSSFNYGAADGMCSVGAARSRGFCFATQSVADTRFLLATGGARLDPGQSLLVVVAIGMAAPLYAPLAPVQGSVLAPELPVSGSRIIAGLDQVRRIDSVAGWLSYTNANGDTIIDPDEVVAAPRSLYWKLQQARATMRNGFLTPQAPDLPAFFTVPGDNRVTIVWERSPTERTGDPYFAIASDQASPAFDPNYRRFDVEGYRIWRGTTPGDMQVIAQFDAVGTSAPDYTGSFRYAFSGPCAPELGVVAACPAFPVSHPLAGDVIQFPPGGRMLLNGGVVTIVADTAVTGGASGRSPLRDTGIPFVFIDSAVQNGRQYFYAVTAFDVNSVASGPSTLESPMAPRSARPRTAARNQAMSNVSVQLMGGDGTVLDPSRPWPQVHPDDGTFSGPVPPANGLWAGLLHYVRELLPAGAIDVRVDSIEAGGLEGIGEPSRAFMTMSAGGQSSSVILRLEMPGLFGALPTVHPVTTFDTTLVPFDRAALARRGITLTDTLAAMALRTRVEQPNHVNTATGVAGMYGRFAPGTQLASRYLSHSRWFDAGAREPPDPTATPLAHATQNSGALSGVSLIWKLASYRVPAEGQNPAGPQHVLRRLFRLVDYHRTTWYPADFLVTWGPGGSITVFDSTHRTALPFRSSMGTGYGFSNASVFLAAGTSADELCAADQLGSMAGGSCSGQSGVSPSPGTMSYRHLYFHAPVNASSLNLPRRDMEATAQLQPIDVTGDGVADGNGIALTINTETWFMVMNALPPAGTRWRLRAIGGQGLSATCTPALTSSPPLLVPACGNYAWAPDDSTRAPFAPGLTFRLTISAPAPDSAAMASPLAVHTVPDPYYLRHSLETGGEQLLRFVNLPSQAIIRIYSSSGLLVALLNHNDVLDGGEARWNLRSRSGRDVASGVYFFHVETPGGATQVGRFAVVTGR